jgi:putative tricarboxylic transport membrane protein
MSVGDRHSNLITGAAGLLFSLAYIRFASGIEDSLLADAVGASGVPVAIGGLMALASALLLVKALIQKSTPSVQADLDEAVDPDAPQNPHRLALGLLLILATYLVLLPWLGYVLAVGLLSAAVAWFAGGREAKVLLGFVLVTGPVLWFLFDFALKVKMPTGIWPTLFAG